MQEVFLNLLPNGVPPVCYISQYDGTSRVIRFILLNGTESLTLDGSETITLNFRKPDREEVTLAIENTSSNYIDLVISSELSDKHGEGFGEFRIQGLGTLSFKMYIESDAYGDSLKTRSISGPIATFETDLAEDLIKLDANINLVQDLHSYDAPWIGGAGKNKCKPLDNPVTRSSGITVTPQADGSVILNGTQVGSSGTVITAECYIKQGVIYTASIGNYDTNIIDFGIQGFGHNKTITYSRDFSSSGVQLYITEGTTVDNVRLYPQVEVGSVATDWTPYENICPISGHDEVNIIQTGKNLLDESKIYHGSFINNIDRIKPNEAYRTAIIDNLPSGTYTFWSTLNNQFIIRMYVDGEIKDLHKTSASYTFTTNGGKVAFCFRNTSTTPITEAFISQVEEGSIITDYEPYTGTAVTVQFGQTVYGGKLDVTSGLLTVTHKQIIISSDTVGTWRWYANYNQAYIENLISDYPAVSYLYEARLMCDKLKPIGVNYRNSNIGNFACIISSGNGLAFGTEYDTLEDFRAWLVNNPITVVYELAEPIEIQLTPQQIEALVGTNVIYADTGDVDVEYYTTLEGGND